MEILSNTELIHTLLQQIVTLEKASNCLHRQVGSLIWNTELQKVVATGTNYTPIKSPCEESNCCTKHYTGLCPVMHSEVNCIFNYYEYYKRFEVNHDKLIMLASYSPCYECSKVLIKNKITKVLYLYKHHRTNWQYLEDCNINAQILNEEYIKYYESLKVQ